MGAASGRFGGDGGRSSYAPRTMRLWGSSASGMLRSQAQDRCLYCGHRMEYFDRYDGGRIPMLPARVPSARIPQRFRWTVSNGVAYHGDARMAECWLPHPAVCPAVPHDDGDRELESLRRVMAVRTRKWTEEGTFVPAAVPARDEGDVEEQRTVDSDGVRHVVRLATGLWLAPGTVDSVRCVARCGAAEGRCPNAVLDAAHEDGGWAQVEIPAGGGRAGQRVLWAGQLMWVWELALLPYQSLRRWIRQRCPAHWPVSTPDAVATEWQGFDPVRHGEFVAYERPEDLLPERPGDHPLLVEAVLGPRRTGCAAKGCRNGSTAPVGEGWLCYQCAARHRLRRDRHHRWRSRG